MAAEPVGNPLYAEIADPGSVVRFGEEIEAANPSDWPGYQDQLRLARSASGARHAVTTGVATVGGEACVIVGFEFAFLGGSMGTAEGARIARAFSVAVAERLPIVCVAASGGSRMQEGTSALLQMQTVAAVIAAARQAGIPHIAVAGDPTTGGVWASLIAGADVLISVPGARVSFSGSRTRPADADCPSPEYLADGKWAHGFVDVLSPVPELRAEVAAVVRLLSPRSRGDTPRPAPLPAWPASDRAADDPPAADPWTHVSAARSPRRASADRWLAEYFWQRFEIRGDRCGGVDAGLRCGFGSHHGTTIAYVAQTGERTTPAGFRTATRLLRLAARLRLPVLTLIDTPGARAAPADEAAGVGPAIAELFVAMASSQVPVTSVVIGEGVSGGALALASPTDLWIARDGYLAVTAPELAVSILKLGARDTPQVASWLRLTPSELMSRGIVRGIIAPPAGNASIPGQAAEPR
jgi:acetyl-CoA carboxylase beta subunit/acetyl-CoA carboxylase alpha subunit